MLATKIVKQELVGSAEKLGEVDDIDKIDDADWEPSNLIADGLQELGFPLALPPGPSSSPMTPAPLTCPSFSGGGSQCFNVCPSLFKIFWLCLVRTYPSIGVPLSFQKGCFCSKVGAFNFWFSSPPTLL